MQWNVDGSVCPACGGIGRGSPRYPAALCYSCEADLIDESGRAVQVSNSDMWSGVEIRASQSTLPKDTRLFVNGIECRAREARFGGIVVQPLAAWGPRKRRE